jgi:cob(I)alamin adenosyltransferase
MLIVFTGNGKGKTTAALGQAFRTLGRGKRVLMIQFIKGPWRSGEDELVSKFKAQKAKMTEQDQEFIADLENFYDFQIKKLGLGFVGILGDTLPKEEHVKAARKALGYAKSEMVNGKWDLLILDEINVATSLGLLTVYEVLEAVQDLPIDKFVIFTGRGAPQAFIDRADLATEMKEIKHPFNDGRLAKIAMEF